MVKWPAENFNLPLLKYVAKFKKPMLISTGMSTLAEAKEAVDVIKKAGNNKIIVFHCTTEYPCPLGEVNLRVLQTFMSELGVVVGYSDHTVGMQASLMATTLGASIIEKHFTLDKSLAGPDHKASMEPKEFKEMVQQLRNVEMILGSAVKKPSASEKKYLGIARKSLVAAFDIKKGEKFTRENLAIKRPGTGMAPKLYDKVLGKIAKKEIKADTLVDKKMF